MAQGKQLKVGDPLPADVQVGAPIPPDASVGGPGAVQPRPEAQQTGAMQRQPGGAVFTPDDIQRGMINLAQQRGNTGLANQLTQERHGGTPPLPAPRGYRESTPGGGPVPGGTIPNDFVADQVTSAPLQALAMSPVGRGLLYALLGSAVGKKAGGYLFGSLGEYPGAIIGGGIGGVKGFKGAKLKIPGPAGALGRLFEEEPGVMPGAAREAAGGTAATTGPAGGSTETALGSQAGPSAPKNAGELSSTVARIRSGTGPGTAASPIYTPESLASEQGMSTAALGKGGFNLTIPPEQQRIMDLVARGKVPMGSSPRPSGLESLGKPTPFPGASPNPPSGTSPSFGEPEGAVDAAIRGAPGQNPVIKSTDRAMAGEMPNKIKFMNLIRKKAQEGR